MIVQFNASADSTPNSTAPLFRTGRVPGMEASSSATQLLVGALKALGADENNLLFVDNWAWISNPTTLFHSLLKIYKCVKTPKLRGEN